MIGANWYILYTEPRAEYVAARELGRDGFEVYFPCIKLSLPRSGRTDMPLFPGYLFLRCYPEALGWPDFRTGHRISGWVNFGGIVPSISDEDVSSLKRKMESIDADSGMWQRFRPGENVWVATPNMEGLAKVIEEAKSPDAMAKVLMQFMGRLVQAKVPWEHLRPVEDRPPEPPMNRRRTRGRGRWINDLRPHAMAGNA